MICESQPVTFQHAVFQSRRASRTRKHRIRTVTKDLSIHNAALEQQGEEVRQRTPIRCFRTSEFQAFDFFCGNGQTWHVIFLAGVPEACSRAYTV